MGKEGNRMANVRGEKGKAKTKMEGGYTLDQGNSRSKWKKIGEAYAQLWDVGPTGGG